MGTNRRYAESIDRGVNERILDGIARGGALETLRSAELELSTRPVTTDPNPAKVRAWVRFGGTPVIVDAEACMWTEHAVAIRFHADNREWRCWVWRGAVRQISG